MSIFTFVLPILSVNCTYECKTVLFDCKTVLDQFLFMYILFNFIMYDIPQKRHRHSALLVHIV